MTTKTINYPTQEWIDRWIDAYIEKHPNERIDDFDALKQDAEYEWWCKEVDKGNPTPNDLTAEQEKASRDARNTHAHHKQSSERKPRTLKENPDKRAIIRLLSGALENAHHDEDEVWSNIEGMTVVKPEREITFTLNGVAYSLTLTAHRPPKSEG